MELEKTVERIVPKDFKSQEEYLLYLRHIFIYEKLTSQFDASDKALEIGFGEGYGTHLLSNYVDSITGLDIESEVVDYANKKYGTSNCSFISYDGKALPFEDNVFDKVILFQVIEHIEDDEAFLRRIRRVLKEGGELHLTTPNRAYRLKPGQEPWNPFHVREYSDSDLRVLLEKIFTKVEVNGINAEPEVRKIETDRVKRNITLKKLIPQFAKRFIQGNFEDKYDTSCYFIERENPSEGLDLYACCSK